MTRETRSTGPQNNRGYRIKDHVNMSKSSPTSPSIPTPSIAVSFPSSNSVQNEAFEVLVDLLASDGIDYVAPTGSVPREKCTSNTTLRDPSGRLDFAKIRSMFEGQNHPDTTGGKVPNSDAGGVDAVRDRPIEESTGNTQAGLDVHQAHRVC